MKVVGTRDPSHRATFREALARNLTPDGGLWVPERLPVIDDWSMLFDLPMAERSGELLVRLLGDSFESDALRRLAREAFDFPVPLVRVEERLFALELFHGPSLAFKDFGARLLAGLLAFVDEGTTRPRTILTATSGDTGAAVARAFWKRPNVRVVVLYPHGRVSPMQERQFAALGDNVSAVAVDGSFDDCQRLAKACFSDARLSADLGLTSANSINLARLLAQLLYKVEAVAALRRFGVTDPPVVSVPSGNFGNLCAGLYAQTMGLPVRRFVAATNVNRTVPDYLDGDNYRPRASLPTLSNAMDVGAPSNWERIAHLFGGDDARIRSALRWGHVDDAQTVAEMERLWRLGWTPEPHAAVASAVLRRVLQPGETGVFLATAHPAKFPESVERVTKAPVPMPEALALLLERPLSVTPMPVDEARLAAWLRG
jgi:threonine synthase